MSAMQRTKGKAGERELARLLSDLTGRSIRRRVRQHAGDNDLIGLADWSIECKRYARATPALIAAWWRQTVVQAEREGTRPVLFWRADRMPDWTAVWPVALHCPRDQCAQLYATTPVETLSGSPLAWWRAVRHLPPL